LTALTPTVADYRYRREITLRWKDNDVYGHVNNVEYYSFFDSVINEYLIVEGGLDIHAGATIGLCAESHCVFTSPVEFPGTVIAGLSTAHVGKSSVRYEIGLFDASGKSIAEGWFVHVFVDRVSRRPTPIPPSLHARLREIAR
jgi:acyl-CoA thioester hydrolase